MKTLIHKLICVVLFFLGFGTVFAHGTQYFEIAPKITNPYDASTQIGDVFEVFLPQNDNFSGFDIWVHNEGSSEQVAFGLRKDGESTLLANKTVIVPYTPTTFGGKRLHVDWADLVPVDSNSIYTIKILPPSNSSTRFYQFNRKTILLGHNAPYTSEYINGIGRIDTLDQDFAFKLALYETNETLPPVITNATATIIDLNSGTFSFNANEPVDFSFSYGPQGGGTGGFKDFSGGYELCSEGATPCSEPLTIEPDLTYDYILITRDEWGNVTQISGSFVSLEGLGGGEEGGGPPPPPPPPGDTTSPVISNLRVLAAGEDFAQVTWDTNEVADSLFVVTLDLAGTQFVTSVQDSTLELTHTLTSNSVLQASTTYYAQINSQDAAGNPASSVIGFVTANSEEGGGEEEGGEEEEGEEEGGEEEEGEEEGGGSGGAQSGGTSAPGSTPQAQITQTGQNSFLINLSNLLSVPPTDGYRIDVFDENNLLVKQIFVAAGEEDFALKGLPPGKYTIIIYSNNGGIFERIAEPTEFVVEKPTLGQQFLAIWPYALGVVVLLVGTIVHLVFREKRKAKDLID